MSWKCPKFFDGTVEVKAISREAGARTKMAVWSKDPNVNPVSACIGEHGARVAAVVEKLGGEKIDVIRYSEQPEELIAAALSPAEVSKVLVDPTGAKACKAIVPDSQLSLAIGNKGQNVRLAARLTGWKIDIGPESQAEQIIEEMETLRRETQEQIDKAVEDLFADEEFLRKIQQLISDKGGRHNANTG